MWRKLLRSWKARIGLVVLGCFVLFAIFGPWFASSVLGFDPAQIDTDAFAAPPGGRHLLGATVAGQDVLAQLIAGTRQSMLAGLLATIVGNAIALLVGVTGGMAGGKVDALLAGFTNMFLTMPAFALILIAAGYLRGGGTLTIGILMGVFGWAGAARAIRAQTMSLRSRDYIVAMSGLGEGRFRLACNEIIPGLGGLLSSLILMGFVAGVMGEAGFAYLGITSGTEVSWGTMISDAQTGNALISGWWWWFLPPGLCIVTVGAAVTMVNFGVDEIINPRLSSVSGRTLRDVRRIQGRLVKEGK